VVVKLAIEWLYDGGSRNGSWFCASRSSRRRAECAERGGPSNTRTAGFGGKASVVEMRLMSAEFVAMLASSVESWLPYVMQF
jgi:hypothetical protein